MATIALVNPGASGVGANGVKRMRQAPRALGVDSDVVTMDLNDPAAQLRDLAARMPETFVVWGGDGTHRSALSTIGRSPFPLLLLPGGTKNFLTRSLHGGAPWEDILQRVLARPVQRLIPAGEIGQERFFCAALAGAPARLAQARETLRRGYVGRAVADFGAALAEIAELHLSIRYRNQGCPEQSLPESNLVAGLVGPLSVHPRMEVAVLPHPSVMATLDVVWSSFNLGFRELPGVVTAPADVLEVEDEDGGEIPLVIDGETISAERRVVARFLKEGGYCLTAS